MSPPLPLRKRYRLYYAEDDSHFSVLILRFLSQVEGIDDLEFHLNIIHDLYQQKYMIERPTSFHSITDAPLFG